MFIVNFEALYGVLIGIDYVADVSPDGVDESDEGAWDLLRFHFLIFAMYVLIQRR
jgi:hypothetical protein